MKTLVLAVALLSACTPQQRVDLKRNLNPIVWKI